MRDPAVDAYLAAQPEANRALLERVRAVVHEVCPDAVEVISYSMPGFRLGRGRVFLSFAGYQRHCAIYPATEAMKAALGDELAPFLAERSTIRFTAGRPLPDSLLRRIVELLAAERAGSSGA